MLGNQWSKIGNKTSWIKWKIVTARFTSNSGKLYQMAIKVTLLSGNECRAVKMPTAKNIC